MISQFVYDCPHSEWSKYIHFFQFVINSSKHETTGYTPPFLMFNRKLRVPLDNALCPDDTVSEVLGNEETV